MIVDRTSIIFESSELSIPPHHDAAAQENQDLKNYPKDQNRRDERLIQAKTGS
jgi:hypothetical protein